MRNISPSPLTTPQEGSGAFQHILALMKEIRQSRISEVPQPRFMEKNVEEEELKMLQKYFNQLDYELHNLLHKLNSLETV